MENLSTTLIQPELKWMDIDYNLAHLATFIDNAEATDVIILPEVFNTAFNVDPKDAAEPMEGKTMQWMADKASEKNTVVTGSLTIKDGENNFNRQIWMRSDGTYEYYDKRHLFRLGDEFKMYDKGTRQVTVEHNGWKINLQICYDLRFPVWSRNVNDYDCLLYIANWPQVRSHAWNSLLLARAIENQCYVIGVNRVGFDNKGEYHAGDSQVIDPMGNTIIHAAHNEMAQQVELKKQVIKETREDVPFWQDRDEFFVS